MGSTKTSTGGTSSQTTTYTATPEQRELDQLQLGNAKATNDQQLAVQRSGLDLINQLLQGKDLPGYLNKIPGGIDEGVTSDIVKQSLRDIQPQFQQSGLLDSGVNASISARTAGDIRRASAETNLNNLFNLLNLGVGGQAQIQQPLLAQSQMLGQRLAGLASSNTTGTFNNTSKVKYDFFTSPFTSALLGAAGNAAGGFAKGGAAAGGCWVASELFGGWSQPKTIASRIYVNFIAPNWFKRLYLKYGEQFALWLKNKPFIKNLIRPLFEKFAIIGGYNG